jgi:hypothetical protein
MGVWNGLMKVTLFQMGKFNSKVEPSPGTDCVRSSRFHCNYYFSIVASSLHDSLLHLLPEDAVCRGDKGTT